MNERINGYILVIFQIPHPKMKGQVGFAAGYLIKYPAVSSMRVYMLRALC